MYLGIEMLANITCGAVEIVETERGYEFRRFTEEQTKYYAIYRNEDYAKKTLTAAGVRLAFRTDSENLSFKCDIKHVPGGGFGYFDICVNGAIVDHYGVESGEGVIRAETALGDGMKTVEVYLPWSKHVALSDVELDDGAAVIPVKRSLTAVNYGDSITHGYYSKYPSLSYASQLASLLDADSLNKAIGGDRFFPELLELPEDIDPDIVTVAYGTNDWSHHSRATLVRRSRDFYVRLSQKYPRAKIFAISPIWRSLVSKDGKFDGPCTDVYGIISDNCADLVNVTVIDGWNLTEHIAPFYTDGLHPNDLGMGVYARNLYAEIKKYL